MLSNQIVKNIECAIGHKCAREANESAKCAQCALGYLFIACEPTTLKCGHHVCKECEPKVSTRSLNCKLCGDEMKSLERVNSSSEALVSLFINDLAKELKNKYNQALDLYQGALEEIYLFSNECIKR